MFSRRVPHQLEANRFSRALGAARAAGRELIDLTISNPTRAGIAYPEGLFASLAGTAAAGLAYGSAWALGFAVGAAPRIG